MRVNSLAGTIGERQKAATIHARHEEGNCLGDQRTASNFDPSGWAHGRHVGPAGSSLFIANVAIRHLQGPHAPDSIRSGAPPAGGREHPHGAVGCTSRLRRTKGSTATASIVKIAPATNVICGPAASHSRPATTLAASVAIPVTRLNRPKAVPRRSAGAVSATSEARIPWVSPI